MSQPAIPVLMYHALAEAPAPGLHPLHLHCSLFEQQLAWLRAQGYAGITATELCHRLDLQRPAPKTVAFTFDDGYLSLLTRAAPLLHRYGFSATLFLTTGFVDAPDFSGAPDVARSAPATDRPLTWAEVAALQAMGWDIQAHSHRHQPHAGLSARELLAEMQESRRCIAERLGRAPHLYAFPYGSYSRHALARLPQLGYAAGFSVHSGRATPGDDRRRLPRLEVNSACTLPRFARLVETGYASKPAEYRARLRDALFHFPLLKDGLRKTLGSGIN
ncbi:polysaccharide deacetylase family protein [Hymenobacter daeguensis]